MNANILLEYHRFLHFGGQDEMAKNIKYRRAYDCGDSIHALLWIHNRFLCAQSCPIVYTPMHPEHLLSLRLCHRIQSGEVKGVGAQSSENDKNRRFFRVWTAIWGISALNRQQNDVSNPSWKVCWTHTPKTFWIWNMLGVWFLSRN